MNKRPIVLAILDGWGYREERENNAIAMADTEAFNNLWNTYPHTTLEAGGRAAGLPTGQVGNSEVGHLNIGAGRVVWQDITRIDVAVEDGSFFQNPVILNLVNHVKKNNSRLHFIGLVSDGRVHASDIHYKALLELAKQQELYGTQVAYHCILDGRDKPPTTGIGFVLQLKQMMAEANLGVIASVVGRYYGMDRDNRWERTQKAYELFVNGAGQKYHDPVEAVQHSYMNGVTDEFVLPAVMVDANENPVAPVRDGDAVFFFNFRADRMRQIVRAFSLKNFNRFPREKRPDVMIATMTEYEEGQRPPFAFKRTPMVNTLPEVVSGKGLRWLAVAETEKYAHITYFFNGGVEKTLPNEKRILVPSPKVPTYDLQPEMSAKGITDNIVQALEKDEADIIVCNFANADMVGHTGNLARTVEAVDAVDGCIERIKEAVAGRDGVFIITADHGNAEEKDTTGQHTAHTNNPVPFILYGSGFEGTRLRRGGALCDVAPTILEILDIPQPPEMDGKSLLVGGRIPAEVAKP